MPLELAIKMGLNGIVFKNEFNELKDLVKRR